MHTLCGNVVEIEKTTFSLYTKKDNSPKKNVWHRTNGERKRILNAFYPFQNFYHVTLG